VVAVVCVLVAGRTVIEVVGLVGVAEVVALVAVVGGPALPVEDEEELDIEVVDVDGVVTTLDADSVVAGDVRGLQEHTRQPASSRS
jgi:hypothetical protein